MDDSWHSSGHAFGHLGKPEEPNPPSSSPVLDGFRRPSNESPSGGTNPRPPPDSKPPRPTTPPRVRRFALLAIPVLATGLFVFDWSTPLGVRGWYLYVIPLLLSLYVGGRFLPYLLAAVFSALILAGFYLSPPATNPHLAL
ncbi:MAG: hypothetical protein ABSA47_19260, partial [Verrucomicrobiota bacterium]